MQLLGHTYMPCDASRDQRSLCAESAYIRRNGIIGSRDCYHAPLGCQLLLVLHTKCMEMTTVVYKTGSHYIHPCWSTELKNEHVVPVSHPLICSRRREIRTRTAQSLSRESGMEKPTWAEDLKPVGVYYEGVVDDATAVVERLTAKDCHHFWHKAIPAATATTTGWQREHPHKEPGWWSELYKVYWLEHWRTMQQIT